MATPGQGFRIMGADLPLYGSSPLERLVRGCRDCWRAVFPGVVFILVLSGPPLLVYQMRAAKMRADAESVLAERIARAEQRRGGQLDVLERECLKPENVRHWLELLKMRSAPPPIVIDR